MLQLPCEQPTMQLYIESLQERIVSLEQKVENQTTIIFQLISKQTCQVTPNQPAHQVLSPHTAAPPSVTTPLQVTTPSPPVVTAPTSVATATPPVVSGRHPVAADSSPAINAPRPAATQPPAFMVQRGSSSVRRPPPTNSSSSSAQAKRVDIIGDSMIGGFFGWTEDSYMVKAHPYGGGTSCDMVNMSEIAMRRNPDVLIVHAGTNDFQESIDTKSELAKVIRQARSQKSDIKIAISAICHREDKRALIPKIADMNNQLRTFCQHHQVGFIEHKNFTSQHLARKKLHPKGYGRDNGNTILINNVKDYLKSLN